MKASIASGRPGTAVRQTRQLFGTAAEHRRRSPASPLRDLLGIPPAIDPRTIRHDAGPTVALRSGAIRFGPDGLRAQFSAGLGWLRETRVRSLRSVRPRLSRG